MESEAPLPCSQDPAKYEALCNTFFEHSELTSLGSGEPFLSDPSFQTVPSHFLYKEMGQKLYNFNINVTKMDS